MSKETMATVILLSLLSVNTITAKHYDAVDKEIRNAESESAEKQTSQLASLSPSQLQALKSKFPRIYQAYNDAKSLTLFTAPKSSSEQLQTVITDYNTTVGGIKTLVSTVALTPQKIVMLQSNPILGQQLLTSTVRQVQQLRTDISDVSKKSLTSKSWTKIQNAIDILLKSLPLRAKIVPSTDYLQVHDLHMQVGALKASVEKLNDQLGLPSSTLHDLAQGTISVQKVPTVSCSTHTSELIGRPPPTTVQTPTNVPENPADYTHPVFGLNQ